MIIVSPPRVEPMRRCLALPDGASKHRLLDGCGGASATYDACVSLTPAVHASGASGAEGDVKARRRTLRRPWAQSHGVPYYC
jgi:predicted lipoprotein with Yx(FWY)xxD motif